MNVREDILAPEEVDRIILALLTGQGADGATDEEMDEAVAWARMARLRGLLVDMILDGRLVMRRENGGGFRFVASESAARAARQTPERTTRPR